MNNSTESKIFEIIIKPINTLGFDIVQISFNNINVNILEVLIERLDSQSVSISDCALVSKNISILLDIEEVIKDKYFLEVSSPGVERPLVKFQDYIRFINHEVKIKLKQAIDNRSTYNGKIINAIDNEIRLAVGEKEITINFDYIKNARLVFTDEMFKKLLNKKSE